MNYNTRLFDRHHGLMRTSELLADGRHPDMLRWGRSFIPFISVRRGWWAAPDTPAVLLDAWRAGGRLACISALAFHGAILDQGRPLHIDIPLTSKGPRTPGHVVHWSSNQSNGDRRAVSLEVALRQASRCLAANGSL